MPHQTTLPRRLSALDPGVVREAFAVATNRRNTRGMLRIWSARGMLRSAAAVKWRAIIDDVAALLRREGYAFPPGAIREVKEMFDELIAEVK